MLFAASGLIGRPVAASDGRIGAVRDFLVDDGRWDVRWMVVDTGQWMPGRRVLIHPSAVAPIRLPPKPALPMLTFGDEMAVSVNLTVREVEAGPDARDDEPVTEDLERRLFDHYGWDPSWSALASLNEPAILAEEAEASASAGDRSSGSAAALKGFAVHGEDGAIGSVDNVLIDDTRWTVRYLVVATRGWLHGKLVQVPVRAVAGIDRQARDVRLDVPRERVQSAPAWDPLAMMDAIAEERVSGHFRPPGRRP
jgi:PRC-barrel domain